MMMMTTTTTETTLDMAATEKNTETNRIQKLSGTRMDVGLAWAGLNQRTSPSICIVQKIPSMVSARSLHGYMRSSVDRKRGTKETTHKHTHTHEAKEVEYVERTKGAFYLECAMSSRGR